MGQPLFYLGVAPRVLLYHHQLPMVCTQGFPPIHFSGQKNWSVDIRRYPFSSKSKSIAAQSQFFIGFVYQNMQIWFLQSWSKKFPTIEEYRSMYLSQIFIVWCKKKPLGEKKKEEKNISKKNESIRHHPFLFKIKSSSVVIRSYTFPDGWETLMHYTPLLITYHVVHAVYFFFGISTDNINLIV